MLISFTSTAYPEINNMSTQYTYKYSRAAVGYLAEIFDPSGKKFAEVIDFGKHDAKKQVQKTAGILNSNSVGDTFIMGFYSIIALVIFYIVSVYKFRPKSIFRII